MRLCGVTIASWGIDPINTHGWWKKSCTTWDAPKRSWYLDTANKTPKNLGHPKIRSCGKNFPSAALSLVGLVFALSLSFSFSSTWQRFKVEPPTCEAMPPRPLAATSNGSPTSTPRVEPPPFVSAPPFTSSWITAGGVRKAEKCPQWKAKTRNPSIYTPVLSNLT